MSERFIFDELSPVVRGAGAPLTAVSRELIFQQLGHHGYLILRDFASDLAGFSDFVRSRSSRLSLDPARVFYDSEGKAVAQKVDAGVDAVGLHCENGNSPFAPDLCWFYCDVAPSHGSQTTVCDGIPVFDTLSRPAQQAFLERDIAYSRRVPRALWHSFVKHSEAADATLTDDAALFERLRGLVNRDARAQIRLEEDGAIFYRFQTSALSRSSPFRERYTAFANSIFGPSYNYERPVITFADGAAISDALLREVGARCAEHTRDIVWQARDTVVIDNRRVMHGRRAITDSKRSIFNALSYV